MVGLPKLLQDGTNTYVYGIGLISTTDGSGNQTYPQHDGLGSTVALANGSGAITGTYSYDVFGAVRSHTGGSTEFGFTGEQNDPNGLEYLRARYYDPATGRFMSQDRMFGVAISPITLNRYVYAYNDPVNFIDPTGLSGAAVISGPLACDRLPLSGAIILCGGGGVTGAAGVGAILIIVGIVTYELAHDLLNPDPPSQPNAGQTSGPDVAVTPPNPDPLGPLKNFLSSLDDRTFQRFLESLQTQASNPELQVADARSRRHKRSLRRLCGEAGQLLIIWTILGWEEHTWT